MPIYEYDCEGCKSGFELIVRGGETPTCPECGSAKLEKRFSVPAGHSKSGLPIAGGPMPETCGRPVCQRGGCQNLG